MESTPVTLYLDLIERCLLNSIYEDESLTFDPPTTFIKKIANKFYGGLMTTQPETQGLHGQQKPIR